MTLIQHRRGTAADWSASNPVLAAGEFGVETDTLKFKVGNGSLTWNSLPYSQGSSAPTGLGLARVDNDPEIYRAGTGRLLSVPTHVTPAGGQVTHPSIVYFPDGWNGWKYWMGITPYPGGEDAHEDPNIVVSADGDTWSQPAGVTQPLDNQVGSPTAFNSDTHLFFDAPTGTLYLFWRTVDKTVTPWNENIYRRSSTNGTTWSARTLVHTSKADVLAIVSPSIEKIEGIWHMWGMDMVSKNIVLKTSANLTTWGPVTVCAFDNALPSDRQNWHIEVRYYNGAYVGILNDCEFGKNGLNGDIYFISSTNGVSWKRARRPLVPRSGPQHIALYRASMVPMVRSGIEGFDLWYPGWTVSPSQTWNLFRTWVQPSATDAVSITHVPPMPAASGISVQGNIVHKKNEATGQGEVSYHLKFIFTAAKTIPAAAFLSLGNIIPTHLRSPVDKAFTSYVIGYLGSGVVCAVAINQFSGEMLVRMVNTSTAFSAGINQFLWIDATLPWPDGPFADYPV